MNIVAYNQFGDGPSMAVTLAPQTSDVPSAPSAPTLAQVTTNVKISWLADSTDYNNTVTGY